MNATLRHAGWVLRTNPVTAIAAFGTALMLTVAILSPWLMPHDPLASNVPNALRPPSAAHWAGTDQLGRDIFSRPVSYTHLDVYKRQP